MKVYYATLRQKQGELRALRKLVEFQSDISQFVPNIIIKDAAQDSLNDIRGSYTGFVLLDVRDLDSEDIYTLEELLENDNNPNFDILYPIEYLLNNNGRDQKSYVRISKSVVNPFFNQWLNSNQSTLPDTVMLDLEYIESVSTELISKFSPLLGSLRGHNIIIMSGAVPQTVPVSSEKNYNIRRIEKDLFHELKKSAPKDTTLYFGDYTSVSPIISTGGRAIVQIKYTLEDQYWFVRNGLRRGNYDFVSVCQEIVNSDGFDGGYCWGDEYIQSVINDNMNKGNPSVWTSIGINRHIVVCLDEI